jgi:hypothetical protein
MPLQIRRGLNSQRNSITPAAGELIYVTDDQRLYIGDGTTVGGISVTGFTTEDAYDATAQIFANGTHTNITFTHNDVANSLSAVVSLNTLTENLNAGGFDISNIGDITGTGNITLDGLITADFKGSVFAADSGLIIDAETRSITADLLGNVLGSDSTLLVNYENSSVNLDQTIRNNVVPSADASYDLGSSGLRFNNLFLTEAITMAGSIRRDTDSFVMMDVGENFINLDGTIKGNIVPDTSNLFDLGNLGFRFGNLYLGSPAGTSGGRSIVIDNVQIRAENTSLFLPSSFFVGTVPLTAVGSHIDLPLGSTVDGIPIGSGGGGGDGVIAGNNYNINIVADDSTLMIDAQNNEIITVTLSTAFIQTDDSSDITVRNRTVFESDIIVENEIRGFLIGDLEGETRGNHIGPVLAGDSTMLVDVDNQAFYGDLTGNVAGNLTGNILGNVIGDVTGDLTGSVNAGSGTVTAGQVFATTLFGRLYGEIYTTQNNQVYDGNETWRGNFIGDLTGSVFSDNSTRIVDGESGAVTATSVSVNDFLQLPVMADDTARLAAIPTPTSGMVIFMQGGLSPAATNQPQYFDGSNWQNF